MDVVHEVGSHQLVRRPSQCAGDSRRDPPNSVVGSRHEHHVGGVLGEQSELFSRFLDALFGEAALCGVSPTPDHADDPTDLVAQGPHIRGDPDIIAPTMTRPELDDDRLALGHTASAPLIRKAILPVQEHQDVMVGDLLG